MVVMVMMMVVTMRSRSDADVNAGAVMVVMMMVSDHDLGGPNATALRQTLVVGFQQREGLGRRGERDAAVPPMGSRAHAAMVAAR